MAWRWHVAEGDVAVFEAAHHIREVLLLAAEIQESLATKDVVTNETILGAAEWARDRMKQWMTQ